MKGVSMSEALYRTYQRVVTNRLILQLVKYTLVSGLALSSDLATFYLALYLGTPAPTAGVMGYSLGLVLHFVLSSNFVFDTAQTEKTKRLLFIQFAASGLIGVIATWVIIFVTEGLLGYSPTIAKGCAVLITFIMVFVIRRSIVFAK